MSESTVRIIGGKWRSRKISFPEVPNLRPTGDRLKETLFNWLGPRLRQARCLDAFAGSGALGLEAISRGARFAQFWEMNTQAYHQLSKNIELLEAGESTALDKSNAIEQLALKCSAPFEVIFLDPPFSDDVYETVLKNITQNGWLADNGLVAVEADSSKSLSFGLDWHVYRCKVASGVQLYLLEAAR
jgi:16S rRNA (guanine966-N2)-methyltransferase